MQILARPMRPRVRLDRLRLAINVDPLDRGRLFEALVRHPDAHQRWDYDSGPYRYGIKGPDLYLSFGPVNNASDFSVHLYASTCESGRVLPDWRALLSGISLRTVEVSQIEVAVDYPMAPTSLCPWAPFAKRQVLGLPCEGFLAGLDAPNLITGGSRKRRTIYDKVRERADRHWMQDVDSEVLFHLEAARKELGVAFHLTRVEERLSLDRNVDRRVQDILHRVPSFRGFGLVDLACAVQHDPLLALYVIVARSRGPIIAAEFFDRFLEPDQRKEAAKARRARMDRLVELSASYIVQPALAVAQARGPLQDRIEELALQIVGTLPPVQVPVTPQLPLAFTTLLPSRVPPNCPAPGGAHA